MHAGRYRLGDVLVLPISARNSAMTPTKSTAAPAYTIYDAAGSAVATGSFSLWDSLARTGWYRLVLRLSSTYTTGRYDLVVTYAISGVTIAQLYTFDVVAGGNSDGIVFGLGRLASTVRWLLGHKTGGKLDAYRNARVQ